MAWYSGSWTKRRQLTVDAGLSASTLTDFPLDVLFTALDKTGSARQDANDILFTDADEVTKLDHQLIRRKSIIDGAWTWFSDPRCHYDASSNKLYGGALQFVNHTGGTGNPNAFSVDLSTGQVERFELAGNFQQDDHDNPIPLPLSDGTVVYFYALHGDSTGLRMRRGTTANSVSAFAAAQTVPGTGGTETSYANPYRFGADIFVLYRGANYDWYYVHTTEANIASNVWDAPVKVFGVGGGPTPYQKTSLNRLNPNRIDFLQTDNHPVTAATSAYHMYAEFSAGTLAFKNSAGTAITLPATTSTMTLVHSSATSSCWIWGISSDATTGYPAILYTTFPTPSSDHRYWSRRWNGSSWSTEVQVTAAGGGPLYAAETYYTPGGCFDGRSIDILYLSVWVSGVPEVQKWETSDSGATWAKTTDITTGTASGQVNIRPYSPPGYSLNGPAVFWCSGTYASFVSFALQVHCWPALVTGAAVRLPTFAGSTSKTIYCYYGNSGAAAQENPSGVWDANFKRVFRAQEPAGTILQIADETGNAHATKRTAASPLLDTAAPGPAGRFVNSASDHWSLGASSVLNMAGWTGLTIEVFANFGGTSSTVSLFSNWDSSNACAWLRTNSGVLQGFVRKTSSVQVNANTVAISSGHRYCALAFDTTDLRVQVDATESSAAATGAPLSAANSGQNVYVGRDPITGVSWDGLIYEARISNVRRSADWRNATRRARMQQSTYVTWGSEESASTSAVGPLANRTRLLRSHLIGGITA